ncbi:hypothetical protein N0V93_002544 [Gnomoniopsis smithogilvyi]|uniref:Alternative oxidase n=1 Tax=Gnomoniopsis smithogilvyi TaxID=1191159 RepID=A0A9W8YWR4_9PEZI|nr:hypothetical protein N0V93_002544 [Gnomoniopsis smithogilvyi]
MAKRRDVVILSSAALFAIWFFRLHYGARESILQTWVIPLVAPNEVADANDLYYTSPVNEELKAVCRDANWDTRLVFTCDKSFGGIGNLRNSILLCVRFAILAGAALVTPRIVTRDDDISNYKTSNTAEFSYMFDDEHFAESLRVSCPQMHLYTTLEDAVQERNFVVDPDQIHLEADFLLGEGLVQPAAWREKFNEWLAQQSATLESGSDTTDNTMVVNIDRCYMSYPIYSDGAAFANSFSSILNLRKDIRLLATGVIHGLAERFSFTSLDLSQPTLPGAFFGAHLRTEKDAIATWSAEYGWTHATYEAQVTDYLAQVESGRSEPNGIYLASGDVGETQRFVADAAARGWTALGKFDVLGPEEVEVLRTLRWDQQAAVDYLVLLKASDFAGVAHSSFSWSVALKRHLAANMTEAYPNAPEHFRDDLSVIYGTKGSEDFLQALWP